MKPKRRGSFKIKGAPGFFDDGRRLQKLAELGDPLLPLNKCIDWELFRPDLMRLYEKERKAASGRKPIDVVLMFRILILQRLHNLSDDQTEYMIRDRASFQRFLGLHVEDGSPDAKTIWKFREQLSELALLRDLFFRFDAFLNDQGLQAKGGQIIDATIVEVPRQRNTREENAQVKDGAVPPDWASKPNKAAQKDIDACWTKKRGQTYYGYKNHIAIDEGHKIIRDFTVTDASVHDSQVMDDILDITITDRPVYADSAYRSEAREALLRKYGVESRIHERAYKNAPLSDAQRECNKAKSSVRVRVEHVFGFGHTSMHCAGYIRCIGGLRAQTTVALNNLTYNMSRFVQIFRTRDAQLGSSP